MRPKRGRYRADAVRRVTRARLAGRSDGGVGHLALDRPQNAFGGTRSGADSGDLGVGGFQRHGQFIELIGQLADPLDREKLLGAGNLSAVRRGSGGVHLAVLRLRQTTFNDWMDVICMRIGAQSLLVVLVAPVQGRQCRPARLLRRADAMLRDQFSRFTPHSAPLLDPFEHAPPPAFRRQDGAEAASHQR